MTLKEHWRKFRVLQKWEQLVIAVFVAVMVHHGSTKGFYGGIRYPKTDPEVWYLMDNGSYVTNDFVHVSYTRNPVVPNSARIYVDALASNYSNQTDWAEHAITVTNGTIATLGVAFDLPFPAASNYNWIVYTDWTPGPSVHTNGIAYVVWQVGADKDVKDIAMIRTGVYTNAVMLAPNPMMTNGNARASMLESLLEETEERK